MKNFISVFYWYRSIRKLSLSGFIGIGRYEKRLSDGHTLTHMYFLYLSRSELTKSYITINTKNGKTKTIEKIIPIIQVEDPNETSVIEYLGELEEAVHLAQDAFSQKPKIEEYSRRKYTRRLKFGVHLELSSGRPNFFYTVSSISKIFRKHILF